MKVIINGLRYDTAKAECVGEAWGGGHNVADWHYWWECLYRTPRSGRFFLHGVGGALSRWGKAIGSNERTSGAGILPLSEDEAFAWAQEHLDADDVEAAFGETIKDA